MSWKYTFFSPQRWTQKAKAPFSLSRFKVPVHPGLMIRDEPCHNRGGTVDNLGDPGWTVLNQLMSPVVLKCLKQPGLTGSNREGCQIPWLTGSPPGQRRGDTGAFREHPCLHREKPCAMKTPGMPDFSTMWYVSTAKLQISLHLRAVWSEHFRVAWLLFNC